MKRGLNAQLPPQKKKDKTLSKLKFLLKQKDKDNLKFEDKFQVLKEGIVLAYQVLKQPHLTICTLESEFYNLLRVMQ